MSNEVSLMEEGNTKRSEALLKLKGVRGLDYDTPKTDDEKYIEALMERSKIFEQPNPLSYMLNPPVEQH